MTQMDLFPQVNGQVSLGDCGVDTSVSVWIIQVMTENEGWQPTDIVEFSRENARIRARNLRSMGGVETRVVPYKCNVDSKGRHNRQIKSERLDY